ncbi:MAG: hypothetical protein HZC40_21595 [Chloroflexi bacterium]|nr:hypothetical protein [Chloroflexota bacterium]
MTVKHQQELWDEVKDLPENLFPNLLQIVHLFKTSILQTQLEMAELDQELQAWDRLSDEAVLEFEKGLAQ